MNALKSIVLAVVFLAAGKALALDIRCQSAGIPLMFPYELVRVRLKVTPPLPTHAPARFKFQNKRGIEKQFTGIARVETLRSGHWSVTMNMAAGPFSRIQLTLDPMETRSERAGAFGYLYQRGLKKEVGGGFLYCYK